MDTMTVRILIQVELDDDDDDDDDEHNLLGPHYFQDKKPTVKGRYVSSPGGQGCNHLDTPVDEVPRAQKRPWQMMMWFFRVNRSEQIMENHADIVEKIGIFWKIW